MYQIKKLTNRGNIDFGQHPDRKVSGTKSAKNIKAESLKELQFFVDVYIADNGLGGGNFIPPKVYKDGRYIGYFSYNCRFWRQS